MHLKMQHLAHRTQERDTILKSIMMLWPIQISILMISEELGLSGLLHKVE